MNDSITGILIVVPGISDIFKSLFSRIVMPGRMNAITFQMIYGRMIMIEMVTPK